MQRFDAAVHHFGKAGDLRYVGNRQALFHACLCRAASRNYLNAKSCKRRRKFVEPGLSETLIKARFIFLNSLI